MDGGVSKHGEDYTLLIKLKRLINYVSGLTATLLNANTTVGQVEISLKELETTFHATIATVNELGEVLT